MDHLFSRQQLMQAQIPLDRIQGKKILIAGAGAIGTSVAPILLNTGFDNLVLLDFDKVECSNLSRASFVLSQDDIGKPKADAVAASLRKRFAGRADIHGLSIDIRRLGSAFIRSFDLVLGCLDSLGTTARLSALCRQAGVPLYTAATERLNAQVGVFPVGDGPCFACGMGNLVLDEGGRNSCDERYQTDLKQGFAPSSQLASSMAAVLLAYEVTKSFQREETEHEILYYSASEGVIEHYQKEKDPGCSFHEELPGAVTELDGDSNSTLGEFFQMTEPVTGHLAVALTDHDYVTDDFCTVCGRKCSIYAPVYAVKAFYCPECGAKIAGGRADVVSRFTPSVPGELLKKTLWQLGFPRGGVFPVYSVAQDEIYYFTMAGDLALLESQYT